METCLNIIGTCSSTCTVLTEDTWLLHTPWKCEIFCVMCLEKLLHVCEGGGGGLGKDLEVGILTDSLDNST